jgi:phosphoribosylaminoimidazolecarboxamide formyltransferase/IMP cyclohydrolase
MAKAIISVSDKTGVVDFSRELTTLGYDILSTGGTARLLEEHKLKVTKISDFTGFEEILDGRVKTLHPKIYAGILANRSNEDHIFQMKKMGLELIDVVAVNLYPFEETVSKPGVTLSEAIENIDIGGVTLIRASAKNFKDVVILTDFEDYNAFIDRIKKYGEIDIKIRKEFAQKAFRKTMEYDLAISNYLANLKIS